MGWSTQGLFQPAIWDQASYAPFLDVLASFLDTAVCLANSGGDTNHAPNHTLPWAQADKSTTPPHDDTTGVTRPDHRLESTEFQPLPCALNDVSPLCQDRSPIKASALVSPDPTPSEPHTAVMTSAGFAARKFCNYSETFAGQKSPNLSLSAYVHRLARYTGCSAACFLYAVSYILRILSQGGVKLNTKTVHR